MFTATSRYHGIETARIARPDGREVVYVQRRLLPTEPPVGVLARHTVVQGDRLDNVTATYLGDPEQFWRLCDANCAVRPDDLCAEDRLGRRLLIPVPEAGSL
ncbi:MAG TPA: LysM domain-containing protein [Nocardioidaceae bacterium]|nr:LysM domain-containing protein [Nocardioidaceae bacterium]